MFFNFLFYFVTFLIYSVVGWSIEIIVCSYQQQKVVDRGFLIGPYCPIYGFSSLLMIFSLNKYIDDPLALFVMATLICTIMEYLTSYFMEKIFHARWWDYTHMKFNINGRVCLTNSIGFGVLGLILMYLINPLVSHLLNSIPNVLFIIIALILLIIFITDVIISFNIITKLKITGDKISKDKTEEITRMVKETIKNKSRLYNRLINAFPDIKILGKVKQED